MGNIREKEVRRGEETWQGLLGGRVEQIGR
jgi:hypothetical protein